MSDAVHWVAVKTDRKEHAHASDHSSMPLANYGQVLNQKHAFKYYIFVLN